MLNRTSVLLFLSVLVSTILVGPASLFAQEEPPPPAAGTVLVEQTSDIDAHGVWSLLMPNHESFQRTDKNLDVPNLIPGHYTFITDPPDGTTAAIDVFLGDDVVAHSDTPQVSFDLVDKMTLRVVVLYTLTVYGKVGVNSNPSGMPFELRGPDDFFERGVTPMEYPKMPIGNYSVTYKPEGCNQPSPKSGVLTQDNRADFSIELVCETFVPVKSESAKHVTTEIGGINVTFTDVPADSWFGSYVATVAKLGVMAGYTNAEGKLSGKFGPGDDVTIAQLSKIVHTLMKIDQDQAGVGAPKNPKAMGQWFTRYVSSAEQLGWLVYEEGTVDPNRPATRGEVLVTLIQALDIPMQWSKGAAFSDVKRNTPFAGAIETAAKEGIVAGAVGPDGKPTGEFFPLRPISRAEMAKIVIAVREKYQRNKSSSSAR
jgi:hypothetical protein